MNLYIRAAVVLLISFPAAFCALLFRGENYRFRIHWGLEYIEMSAIVTPHNFLFVDARLAADYQASHVAGAISLPAYEFQEWLAAYLTAWSPEQTTVVYCDQSCGLSRQVALRLIEYLPEADIRVLRGGIPALQGQETWRKNSE